MHRRTLLKWLTAATAGGSLAVGSGAFTQITTDRTITARVTDDDQAVLALRQEGAGGRSVGSDSPEEVMFSFPGLIRRSSQDGLGLGGNSVYEFDRDSGKTIGGGSAGEPAAGLLTISNQGTQPVAVSARDVTDSPIEVELYDVTDPARTPLYDDPPTLGVGDAVSVGVRIRTFDAEPGSFDEVIEITAATTDE